MPEDYTFVEPNQGDDDSLDSDIDPETAKSETTLIDNGSNTTLDAGIYKPSYCLGDYIWFDNNRNGVQDIDEKGVENVRVVLNETDAETITDNSGYYEFCGLQNGEYSITIDKETIPLGYKITAQNRGNSDMVDSDINPETAKSDIAIIQDKNNMTLDGGIYKPTYCLGDFGLG